MVANTCKYSSAHLTPKFQTVAVVKLEAKDHLEYLQVVLGNSKIITRWLIVMKISELWYVSQQYLYEVKWPIFLKDLREFDLFIIINGKKTSYASLSTVTSITIVQRHNFIKIKISIFDIFQQLPSSIAGVGYLISRGQTTFSPHGAYHRIISTCSEKVSGTFTDHKFFQSHKVPGDVK